MEKFTLVLEMLGGVGIFLYGMSLMASSLEKAAGNKMKGIIEAFTRNRVFGVGVGVLVTMIIQSSTATTIMVVGFVNAGIMSLLQATGVIMGANIGTTVTAQLVAFNLDAVAPVVAGIAAIIGIVVSNKTVKNLMMVMVGFGVMFIGIGILKDAMGWLSESPVFVEFLAQFDNNSLSSYFVLLFVGFLVTALVQSSSTVTGIMIAMASQGLLSIVMAIPLVLGSNIGTTLTTVLSSMGASRNAKRAAFVHVVFNIIGVLLFIVLLNKPVLSIVDMLGGDITRQIANVHTLFNLSTTLIILPFATLLVKLTEKIIPIKESEINRYETSLDARLLETPAVAIGQAYEEMYSMGDLVRENYDNSVKTVISFDKDLIQKIKDTENLINYKQTEIKNYLQKLMQKDISAAQHKEINMMFSMTNDIERVGDHAENIAELAEYRQEHKISFSDIAIGELKNLHELVLRSCDEINISLKTYDKRLAKEVVGREILINELEKEYRDGHMQRLNEGSCTPESGVIFLDAISNMERVADRLKKVGHVIMEYGKNKKSIE